MPAIYLYYRTNIALPNTLCHIALQTPLSRFFGKDRDLLWVIIACIIPDMPWILLRILLFLQIMDPLSLRLYAAIQASLAFCLLFSAALSQFSRLPIRTFTILGLNCLLHLLLDATQIKWGNGVHLFLPGNWSALQWQIFWPEYPLGILITVFGFGYFLWIWPKMLAEKVQFPRFQTSRLLIILGCLLVYLVAPMFFLRDLEQTGYYSIDILRNVQERPGKQIEFDRVPYSHIGKDITIFNGEQIHLIGETPKESGIISLQGRFLTAATIQTSRYHRHTRIRDWASLLGLLMTCTLLVQTLLISRFPFNRPIKGQTS